MNTIIENFNQALAAEKAVIEVQVKISKRIDAAYDIRAAVKEFGVEPTVEDVKRLQRECTETYEKVAEIVDTYDLDMFLSEEDFDPFEDMINALAEFNSTEELLLNSLKFRWIRPFGERCQQLHRMVLDAKAAKKAEEERALLEEAEEIVNGAED